MAGAPPRLVRYGIADEEAWDVGLPCGGEIAVWIQAEPHAEGRGNPLRHLPEVLVTDTGVEVLTLGTHSPRRPASATAHSTGSPERARH